MPWLPPRRGGAATVSRAPATTSRASRGDFLVYHLAGRWKLVTFVTMDKKDFEARKQWAGDAIPSMKRRRLGHDYQGRCIYMVTLVVEGRRPLLGDVTGDGEGVPAMMRPSALGRAVLEQLANITLHYPAVKVISHQLMPDHLHVILFVQEKLPCHLSRVISGYKGGCNAVYRQMTGAGKQASLWEEGYNDRILEGRNHLQRMMDYIDDNPRRLAVRRHHNDYFRVQQQVQAGGLTFAALGNVFLLQAPVLLQVQCSRSLTPEEIEERCHYFLSQAENGAVMVSPSISKGEKAVMDALQNAGFPVILLLENGFAPLAKPGGKHFDACAEGRLLLLAPWKHHNTSEAIKRGQCLALNDMAAAIARK